MGFKIARIFGVDIELDWSVFLLFGLLVYSFYYDFTMLGAAITAVLFLFSLVFHEMAHSLMANHFRMDVKKITLFMFGGVAHLDPKKGFGSPGREFFVAVVGPLSSIVLAVAFYILSQVDFLQFFALPLAWLSIMNILLAVFNSIPLFPMDGGRVWRSLVWWLTKDIVRATKIARNTTVVLAIAIVLAGFFWTDWMTVLWFGIIFWMFIIPAAQGEYLKVMEESRNGQA